MVAAWSLLALGLLAVGWFSVDFARSPAWSTVRFGFAQAYGNLYGAMLPDPDREELSYHVVHSDLGALQRFAEATPAVERIETGAFDDLVTVTLAAGHRDAVAELKALPEVRLVLRTSLPLICH